VTAQTGSVTGVTVNLDGTLMYYTVEKSGEHALYKATKTQSGTWTAGVSEDAFNEHIKGYEIKTPFLTYDGQTLYFSANLPDSKGFDIFYSQKNGDSWSIPVALSPVINTERDEISPSLSADNLTIYFTRNEIENNCYNIYTSEVDISGWSVPRILPVPISTGCEKYVHISPAGETLLFSTDRTSEKKKKKYNIFSSSLISKNLWTTPLPIDNAVKEYNEFTPAVDYNSNKIVVTKGDIDSLICRIHSYDAPVSQPYTILKGIIKDEDNQPVNAAITIRNAYTYEFCGKSESNPVTGEYSIVLPNNGLYNIAYAVKNGAQQFETINTVNNTQGQTITKNVTLIGKVVVNVTVQDAFSDNFIDVEINAYEKTKTAKVSKVGEGKYQIITPALENVDIELYKENYIKENIYIKFSDCVEFPEMYYSVRLKPDMRSGVINVKSISSNQGINANVEVKNFNIKDDKVIVSSAETGKYEFDIRKDSKYSVSITLKDCFYYYAVWKADASRIGQTLDIRLVPLQEISKIPMTNLLFSDGKSTLSDEASGELECIIKVLKNNPEYMAVISLYHLNIEKELTVAQQRARSIMTFMEANRIPKSAYRIEVLPVDKVKIPDINFVINAPTDKQ
jgi:outer membrane protein OmpA-like peptidoglycan-associated protein